MLDVMLTVMVTGGRDYNDRDHLFRVLDRINEQTRIREVIHGACGWDADDRKTMTVEKLRGADRWADVWARERRVRVTRCPAHWTTVGPAAGPRRNAAMITNHVPDRFIVFPGGRGTNGARKIAERLGLSVIREDVTVISPTGEPKT